MAKLGKLDEIADQESDLFLRNQAMLFVECAINLMVTCMTVEETIEFLDAQIDILEEYG